QRDASGQEEPGNRVGEQDPPWGHQWAYDRDAGGAVDSIAHVRRSFLHRPFGLPRRATGLDRRASRGGVPAARLRSGEQTATGRPENRTAPARSPRRPTRDFLSYGVRFRTARPRAGSAGTETWSCTTSQTPSICRKHAVQRNHMSTAPLGSAVLMWL